MPSVSKNGDRIYWTIKIKNDGADPNTNVVVDITIPPGVTYKSYTSSTGVYSSITKKWTVGNHPVGAEYELKLEYAVTDISLAPFTFEADISGDLTDPNNIDNHLEIEFTATTCPPEGGAIGDPMACLCGDVSLTATLCDHGRPEFRLLSGSTDNLSVGFDLDVDTGTYNASGFVIDPYEDATFQWSLWCITGVGGVGNEWEVSGPVTVVIPALFQSTFTDSMAVDSSGGFDVAGYIKHTSMDGTEFVFRSGWTVVTGDPVAKNITFAYPDLTVIEVDIWPWFPSMSNFTTSVGGYLQYDIVSSLDGTTISTVVTTIPVAASVQNVSTYDASVYSVGTTFTFGTLKNHTKLNDSITDLAIILPDPATSGLPAGQTSEYTFKRVNETPRNGITFASANSKYIDGHAAVTMADESQSSISFWHDNTNWFRK